MNDGMIISNIKGLGIDMIEEAKSGHPGIVLGAAPILYTLYKNHMKVNTCDPNWVNRDRFVMSAGHGSALLYATLYMVGYGLTIDDLKSFRRIGSKTPGHPEVGTTPGVDCSTGPLGQGLANAVGLALGEKLLEERYRLNPTRSLIDYHVYALVGDGDLMEGVSYEAASFAGTLKLNNLIVLYDSNDVSLDGPIQKTFQENVRDRFKAMGWETILVKEGDKVEDIDKAIHRAKKSDLPTLIEVKTKIGQGSLLEGQHTVHGKVLTEEDVSQLRMRLGLPNQAFYVNEEEAAKLRGHIASRVNDSYMAWTKNYQEYTSFVGEEGKMLIDGLFHNQLTYNVFDIGLEWRTHTKEALRDTNGKILEELGKRIPLLVGGSADVGTTTKTYVSEYLDVSADSFRGNNIWFGVREHAMGAILNGLALSHLRPYGSAFLSFADYMKPPMRMAALMKLPVTYLYTHDSIVIGPDGPTHQPIEQLAMLRAIPNMKVYRPADAKELLGCWQMILDSKENPSALVLTRQEVEVLEETDSSRTMKGGYVALAEQSPLKLILVATGSEVQTAKNLAHEFIRSGELGVRVVSMPCLEQFQEQSLEYQNSILPPGVFRVVIEAGIASGWESVITHPKYMIGLSTFGYSGTKDEVLEAMNFSYSKIRERLFELLKPQ